MRLRAAKDPKPNVGGASAFGAAAAVAKGLKIRGKTDTQAKDIMKGGNGLPPEEKDRPAGLPRCIPASAASIFFGSTPELQRELIREASKPAHISRKRHNLLESAQLKRRGEMLCMCKELKRCPLQTAEDPADDPQYDGMTTQWYPSDAGWWKMRDICVCLSGITGTAADNYGQAIE